jgi:hypothetical protein
MRVFYLVWPCPQRHTLHERFNTLKQKSVQNIAKYLVIRDEVWIGNSIYWAPTPKTGNNYDILTELGLVYTVDKLS